MSLSEQGFARIQRFIFEAAGISLANGKEALVSGRLERRIAASGARSFDEYARRLGNGEAPEEVQAAIDLLTTNETYFFREPKAFDTLRTVARQALAARRPLRVWSAACSSGEEVYSMAMVLDDCLGMHDWTVFGSDISARVLERAVRGHYPLDRARLIPADFLRRYCRKGQGPQDGTLLVTRELRTRVGFGQVNLNTALPTLGGAFDVIFLRNVMIYFSAETKRQVLARIVAQLRPGGLLCVGLSETVADLVEGLVQVAPATYLKEA